MLGLFKKPFAEISARELQERLARGEKIQLIDVREKHEFARGRIPDSNLIPLGELAARKNEIDPNVETVFVCRSGNRSGRACGYLHQQGYQNVINLKGGMLGWRGKVERS